MRSTINWILMIGSFLIIGGAAVVWLNYQNNLPSPFDIASVSGQNDGFLPIIAPVDVGSDAKGGIATLQPAPTVSADETNDAVMPAPFSPAGVVPDRLVIPAINLDAPIVPVDYKTITVENQTYTQWLAPDQLAVGWQDTSALLGMPGNIVLNGHHNAFGKVFKDLVRLNIGDSITVYSGTDEFRYIVVAKMLLPERYAPLAMRLENGRWIANSQDDRLTLITCWPAASNTHRVVLVAFPIANPDFNAVSDQALQPSLSAGISIRGSVAESSFTHLGDRLHYRYLVTNSGIEPLTGVSVSGDTAYVTCPSVTLDPNASMTCTATYSINKTDITLEKVTNTAYASGSKGDLRVSSDPETQTVEHFFKLNLSAICALDSKIKNSWQVVNENPYNVSFEYAINNDIAGVGAVLANSTTVFETPVNSGTGLMGLYVGGFLQNNSKAATGCQ
jgi:LPXTG-site transpeptidase (sortase) family protein